MDGAWLTGTPLPVDRTAFGCVAISKKIYCIGGSSKRWDMGVVDTILIYDTETGISTYGKSMPTARADFGCVAIGNKIYCYGGYNGTFLTTLEIYDTATNTWSTGEPMPAAMAHLGYAELNGEAYAFNGTIRAIIKRTFKYDPSLDLWSEVATCDYNGILYASSTGGRIYATGGSDLYATMFNKKLFIYDAFSDAWTEGAEMEYGTTGPAITAGNGKVYCIAGMQAATGSGSATIHGHMGIYDIASDSWSYGPPLPTARWDSRAVIVDGKIYCIGGDNNSSKAYPTVEIFTMEDKEPEVPTDDCCCCTKVKIKITTCSKNQDLLNDINDALILDGVKKDCRCCKISCCS